MILISGSQVRVLVRPPKFPLNRPVAYAEVTENHDEFQGGARFSLDKNVSDTLVGPTRAASPRNPAAAHFGSM
jgi:hypothetical protein